MSIIKYRGEWGWAPRIERIEVTAETAATVVLASGRREHKMSDTSGIFDTWQEAHVAVVAHYERKVAGARRSLELANSTLGNAKGLKEPA